MDVIFRSYSSWWWLLVITVLLLGLFFLLGFLDSLMAVLKIRRRWRSGLQGSLRVIRILFEPVALGVWLAGLILINPVIHGILILAGTALIHTHVRNYLSGRIFLLENSLKEGGSLVLQGEKAEIVRMGRLGIKLRTEDGLQHIGYQDLANGGYVLASGSETGEFFNLLIRRVEPDKKHKAAPDLRDLLATSPYVDWSFEPVLVKDPEQVDLWRARIQLSTQTHLPELVQLLGEWGYDCSPTTQSSNGTSAPWKI